MKPDDEVPPAKIDPRSIPLAPQGKPVAKSFREPKGFLKGARIKPR